MEPVTLALIMGGTAAANMYATHRQNQIAADMNKKQANAAAAQTRFSPWTKMGAGEFTPQAPKDMVGAGMQGALSGASFAQSYDAAQSQKSLNDAKTKYYNNASPSEGQLYLTQDPSSVGSGSSYFSNNPYQNPYKQQPYSTWAVSK